MQNAFPRSVQSDAGRRQHTFVENLFAFRNGLLFFISDNQLGKFDKQSRKRQKQYGTDDVKRRMEHRNLRSGRPLKPTNERCVHKSRPTGKENKKQD